VSADNVSGYAVYEHGRLVRAVFINLNAWVSTSTGARPSVHLQLVLGKGGAQSATVRRLAIQHADDVAGMTLAGQSYETPDAKVSGSEQVQTIRVSDGVDIASTEAILLSFY
jgi:Glycosyl hydrolase family 79 C-terminal beta domain